MKLLKGKRCAKKVHELRNNDDDALSDINFCKKEKKLHKQQEPPHQSHLNKIVCSTNRDNQLQLPISIKLFSKIIFAHMGLVRYIFFTNSLKNYKYLLKDKMLH
jgi:hypothetical protein